MLCDTAGHQRFSLSLSNMINDFPFAVITSTHTSPSSARCKRKKNSIVYKFSFGFATRDVQHSSSLLERQKVSFCELKRRKGKKKENQFLPPPFELFTSFGAAFHGNHQFITLIVGCFVTWSFWWLVRQIKCRRSSPKCCRDDLYRFSSELKLIAMNN